MVATAAATASATAQGPRAAEAFRQTRDRTGQPGVAFLASALIPGAGQFYLGKERWVPFIALETWALINYRNQKSRGRSLEREYRDLAWVVARRIDAGVRRDTIFAYYEAVSEYRQSGAFDSDPTVAGVQPELDGRTYNGQQWNRAKAIVFPGGIEYPPGTREYENALAYYRRTAIPPGYGWSWLESDLEQQVFDRLIQESDDALRHASTTLGLILANHVVSAIDALVSARLEAAANGRSQIRVGSALEPSGGSIRWTTKVRLTLGNR